MTPDGPNIYNLLVQMGFGGALLWYIIPRLDKIQETLASLIQLITMLITSLPEVKKRAKEEAESVNRRINEK